MCGILGWMGQPDREMAQRMRDMMTHRGPDDAGEWYDPEHGVWLGQRRLAIIDLSPEGHQPMASPSGRYVLTYNGETYNYLEIREELAALGCRFRGHSDTEVLTIAMEQWGVEKAIEKFAGMFAFGVYDRQERALWLVRDRVGIKPLYYAHRAGEIAFASELRALSPLSWVDKTIDRDALASYLQYLCVPAPVSIWKGAKKLSPGEILRWDANGPRTWRYWTVKDAMERGQAEPLTCSFTEAGDELERRLRDYVQAHLISDVPLGAFLSGGIDSSLVVALMQSVSSRPVKTYSIGFREESHDESRFAKPVAAHLKTEHHEQILAASDLIELAPAMAAHYDEPFADNSSVPTYLLSKFTRSDVTVALSGDGGDELFSGYPRYFWAERIARWQQRLTPVGAQLAGRVLSGVPGGLLDGPVTRLGGHRFRGGEGLSKRVHRMGGYLRCSPEEVYGEMIAVWRDPAELLGETSPKKLGPNPALFPGVGWTEQMMAVDQENFMVDDVLTKVDRASMAVSLEVRVPLLDHRFVEWSWRVPTAYKVAPGGDRGKLLLREVLYRHVPRELIERPKRGFGMPLHGWLRNELRPWAEDLLSETMLKKTGQFAVAPIRKVWQEHLAGKDHTSRLWTILMFQQWFESGR